MGSITRKEKKSGGFVGCRLLFAVGCLPLVFCLKKRGWVGGGNIAMRSIAILISKLLRRSRHFSFKTIGEAVCNKLMGFCYYL